MRTFSLLALASAILLALWAFWAGHNLSIAQYWLGPHISVTAETAGQWGDSFGAFNALISAIGSAAVLATLWLQQKALKDQAKDLHLQRFDATFFETLRLFEDARRRVKFQYSLKYRKALNASAGRLQTPESLKLAVLGVDAIIRARKELEWWLGVEKARPETLKGAELFNEKIFHRFHGRWGSYYRNLFQIMERIHSDKFLSNEDRIRYSRILRAQLSYDEVVLMGFNGLNPYSGDLRKYIEIFRMLKYCDSSNLTKDTLQYHYKPEAFSPRD